MNVLIAGKGKGLPEKQILLLKHQGYLIEELETVKEATERTKKIDSPMLILVNFDSQKGIQFCKDIRTFSLPYPVYLILCVEKTQEELVLKGIKAGAGAVVDLTSGNELFSAYFESAIHCLKSFKEKHQKTEQELLRLAGVVEQSVESILITTPEGTICYTNKMFEKIMGYTAKEIIGEDITFFKKDQYDADFYTTIWNKISKGEQWQGRLVNTRKDGERFYMEALIYPIFNKKKEIIYYTAICHDITHEKEIEKEIRQAQKMVMLGELAGGISHDFNNILTAILGYVALCMNAVDDSDQIYAYLKEIVRAGDRAAKLVRQILAFSRQEEQEFHSVSTSKLLRDSLSMIRPILASNISVKQEKEKELGIFVLGDSTQLQQVFVNLCTNAAHAMKKTGGVLTLHTQPIELLGKWHENRRVDLPQGFYACISIKDTGCGMKSGILDRIFDPYFTTKKYGEGTGFGLSIVQNIVRRHGGTVCVESEINKGTTFTVYLPLIVDSKQPFPLLKKILPTGKGHLLLVDDDPSLLKLGQEMLTSYGFSVKTAETGKKALTIFKKDPTAFDALLSDYYLPVMQGDEIIRQCKKIDPSLPSFLCSGCVQDIEDKDFKDLGKTSFIPKPIHWQQFCRQLQRSIDKRRNP